MFFRQLPDGLGKGASEPQPEAMGPNRDQCLECAFGKLLASSGIQTAEREEVTAVITEGQNVTTATLHTRATIYRCGALGCDHAMMAVTGVEQPILPDDPKDIQMYTIPGSPDCALPKDDTA
jgi:hypothetical protein